MYVVCVGLWKLFVLCFYLIFYFCLFAWLTLIAFGKALAALWKLLVAASKALEHKAEQESLEEPVEAPKPSVKAQPGPRDYNLPS